MRWWRLLPPCGTRHRREIAPRDGYLERAINLHDVPEKITIDKSSANTAAIESAKADACVDILMRQNKYLNNIVEQDHRAIKRITRPILGFKSFWSARIIIAGIETMHMIRRGRWTAPPDQPRPQQTSSMDWHADQMNANGLLRDRQPLMQQNQSDWNPLVQIAPNDQVDQRIRG